MIKEALLKALMDNPANECRFYHDGKRSVAICSLQGSPQEIAATLREFADDVSSEPS